MILDTENITALHHTATVWTTPALPQIDHRVAQLELAVAAQARELSELRSALKGVTAALQRLDGDGK